MEDDNVKQKAKIIDLENENATLGDEEEKLAHTSNNNKDLIKKCEDLKVEFENEIKCEDCGELFKSFINEKIENKEIKEKYLKCKDYLRKVLGKIQNLENEKQNLEIEKLSLAEKVDQLTQKEEQNKWVMQKNDDHQSVLTLETQSKENNKKMNFQKVFLDEKNDEIANTKKRNHELLEDKEWLKKLMQKIQEDKKWMQEETEKIYEQQLKECEVLLNKIEKAIEHNFENYIGNILENSRTKYDGFKEMNPIRWTVAKEKCTKQLLKDNAEEYSKYSLLSNETYRMIEKTLEKTARNEKIKIEKILENAADFENYIGNIVENSRTKYNGFKEMHPNRWTVAKETCTKQLSKDYVEEYSKYSLLSNETLRKIEKTLENTARNEKIKRFKLLGKQK